MRFLWLPTETETQAIAIRPVPANREYSFSVLYAARQQTVQNKQALTKAAAQNSEPAVLKAIQQHEGMLADIDQKLINLHPRLDRPGEYGADITELRITNEFWPKLWQFNRAEAPTTGREPKQDPAAVPPWSCENLYTDLLADFTYSLGNFEQALLALQTLDLQTALNFYVRLQDLQQGPDARVKQDLEAAYHEAVADGFSLEDAIAVNYPGMSLNF
jgi:hypothetical protein